VAQAVEAGRTYLTHLTHEKRHADRLRDLPPGVDIAYDGMKIEFDLQGAPKN
jgi:phosphoribosyl 1,2-cyclic phosphate phosphodiesterase